MAGNATASKKYASIAPAPVLKGEAPKNVSYPNKGGKYEGQMPPNEPFAVPMQKQNAAISGISGTHNDIGELSGFITDGYLDKGGIPYGEAAKFNFLPPGMDINNQENAEIHDMPLRKVTAESYPGDGWMPTPRDLPE
jgi:hypothetical protein